MNAPLVDEFAVVFPHEVSPSVGLELSEDDRQSLIPHFFQPTQHASTEEHLAVAEAVLAGLKLKGGEKELRSLPAVHEAGWDGLGSKDHIPE